MGLSGTVKVGGTTAGVVGGAVAVGYGVQSSRGTQGVLLTKEDANLWDWHRAASRYFVNLIENPNLDNKLFETGDLLNPQKTGFLDISVFRDACLSLLSKTNLTNEESVKKDAWCRKFKSNSDHWEELNKEVEDSYSPFYDDLKSRYDLLIAGNEKVKNFLESVKSSKAGISEDDGKSRAASLWCGLLSFKEYEEKSYRDFESRCIKN